MANAWLAHVKKTREANPGMMFKHVLQLAGKSWKKSPAKKQSGGCGKALGNTHGGDAAEVAEETGGMGSRDSGVQPDSPAMANEMVGGRRRRKSGKKSKKSKKAKKGGKTKKAGKKSRKNKKSRKSRK